MRQFFHMYANVVFMQFSVGIHLLINYKMNFPSWILVNECYWLFADYFVTLVRKFNLKTSFLILSSPSPHLFQVQVVLFWLGLLNRFPSSSRITITPLTFILMTFEHWQFNCINSISRRYFSEANNSNPA